jgi:hypothetical protein
MAVETDPLDTVEGSETTLAETGASSAQDEPESSDHLYFSGWAPTLIGLSNEEE